MTDASERTPARPEAAPFPVVLADPLGPSLLALLLRGVVQTRVLQPAVARRAASLRGDVVVRAGRMAVTLRFDGRQLELREGADPGARAAVHGSMAALLGMVTGRGLVGPLLAGRVRLRGNPLLLLRMLPLIRS